jgi:hypothetical protein
MTQALSSMTFTGCAKTNEVVRKACNERGFCTAWRATLDLDMYVNDLTQSRRLARMPIGRTHPTDKNTRQFNKREHVLLGKVDPLFWDML